MATHPDRRQRERAPLRTVAHVVLAGAKPVEVRTVDISATGAGIVAKANPPAGLKCMVRLAIPAKPKGFANFELNAQVAHSVFSNKEDGFVIGLTFIDPPAQAVAAIEQFLHG